MPVLAVAAKQHVLRALPGEAHLYWHESVENGPANRWLREEIEKVLNPEPQAGEARKPG
jgi:hypothetical protein